MKAHAGPLVSILLPAYDAEATLPACLRSIRRQREADWECVIVDDGSTDATLAIARRAERADDRVRVLSAPHRGLVAALRAGLEACRAPLVARMDADDLMHRDRLAAQVRALRDEPGLAAVGCHVRMFPRSALGPGTREYERWLNGIDTERAVRREAFVECPVAHPTLAIRREALAAAGYREMGWPEDYDLLLRLLHDGRRIGIVPRRLLGWRHRADRLSRTAPAYAVERFTACKASFLASSFLRGAERYVLWGYGGTGRALARALRTHGRRPSHIVELHPGRLGNVIDDAPVVPPEALASLPRAPLVVSVAGAGPRERIRSWLRRHAFVELRDFVCAA